MEKITMRDKISTMISGKPILPGTVGEHYNVCGKKPCRCKDKINPQKHGPYYQLSYNLKGKNSSITIKPSDVNIIRKMTDNYRAQASNTQDLGLELLEVYKKKGCQAMLDKYENLFSIELSKKTGIQPESASLRNVQSSQAKWKEKALERQSNILKLKVKITDLNKSREGWKKKYQQEKIEKKIAEEEITTLKKKLKEQELFISEQNKKNS
jgi:hypothetical protein